MKTTAIILTVFNRCETTLIGLRKLRLAINRLSPEYYQFDIYMTDDGSTDGTIDAVQKEFPYIHIIKGNGSLFWSGGMRLAWNEAIKSCRHYDYFLWLNDDADLYVDALHTLFSTIEILGNDVIVSGAFCDEEGNVSYGGRKKNEEMVVPQIGMYKDVFLMNGNLTLIPYKIFQIVGNIKPIFRHSLGDWDYGCRALKAGFRIVITDRYVGKTNRHDMIIAEPFLLKHSLKERLHKLYSPKYDPRISLYFNLRHMGILKAFKILFIEHMYVFFPQLAIFIRKKIKKMII